MSYLPVVMTDPTRGPKASRARARLLIVDSDATERQRLRRGLEHTFHIWEASTAEEALRTCSEHLLSVVLADYELSDHDGVWLLERIAERHPHVDRALMSKRGVHNLRGLRDAGVFRLFLPKPFEAEEFSAYFDPSTKPAG